MQPRRDLAFEIAAVLACGAAAASVFLVLSWTTFVALGASAAVVAVAGVVAWRSSRPYLILAVGVLSAAAVAIS